MTGSVRVTLTTLGSGGRAQTKALRDRSSAVSSSDYNGKLRDKVGGGDSVLGGDGAADGTMTLTLSAAGGRTVTALQLSNGIGGTWDTTTPNAAWVLGVAPSLDGALLNNATTMAVNATVADGGSLTLFASDYNGGMGFAPGRTLTVTATFSDGSSAQAVTTVTNNAVTVSAVTPNPVTMGVVEGTTIELSGLQYLNTKSAVTCTDIAGDPVVYCNL